MQIDGKGYGQPHAREDLRDGLRERESEDGTEKREPCRFGEDLLEGVPYRSFEGTLMLSTTAARRAAVAFFANTKYARRAGDRFSM
jgi:hypothetical protein